MPLYEFKCDDCGIFDQWRTMAESSLPAVCPCQKPAKRIFSAPALLSGSLPRLKQDLEPRLVQQSQDRELDRPKVKSHTGGRPWMISH